MAKEATTKTSFNLRPTLIKQLKFVALMEGTTQTEIIDTLLTKYVEAYEKKNGKIPSK